MRKDIKQLKELAYEEAGKLLFEATPEERERLYEEPINPGSRRNCIYGRLTGDCFSNRANKLIKKCCVKVCVPAIDLSQSKINGNPTGDRGEWANTKYFSPIEVYIANVGKDEINRLRDYIATGDLK